MDENKEKELLEEDLPENENETLSEQEKEEVSEILEKLKNQDDEAQVVTDWDGLAQVGETNEDIIVENEETDDAEESEETEIEEDNLCIKCSQRERFTELDEDYPYCKVCRENMKKTRMNGWGVFFFVCILINSLFMIIFGVSFAAIASPIIKGDMYMAKNKYTSAITCYEEALATIDQLNQSAGSENTLFDAGRNTYAKLIKAYYESGSITYAQNYFTALEQSGAFDKARYKETGEYNDIYNKMIETYSTLQTQYTEQVNKLYLAEEKATLGDIEDTLAKLEELKSNEDYDKYMVAYFQYIFCSLAENADEECIKYLLEIKEGGRAYEFIYAVELCVNYLNQGEYEKAEAECYESLKASPESIGVYQYLMKSKIKQGDYEAALKLADEAEKSASEIYAPEGSNAKPYTISMEEAICYALMGDEEKALAAIDESYASGNDNSNLNVYILLHYLYHVKGTEPTKGEDGTEVFDSVDNGYDEAMSVISYYGAYYGLSVSENIQAIMDGEKTLEDVFVKGEVNW